MTRSDVQKKMEQVFAECQKLRDAGQKEYAHDEDNAFANFERVAEDVGISRESALWIFAMKHRDGISAYLKGHKSQREDVRGRINDLITYLILLRAMIDDNDGVITEEVEEPACLAPVHTGECSACPTEARPVHARLKL